MEMKLNRYEDQSTTEIYKFVIRCECCNKIVKMYQSSSCACYKPRLFASLAERRAKELLWLRGHDEALDNATAEAFQELNRCEKCGLFVCDNCSVFIDNVETNIVCKSCAKELEKENASHLWKDKLKKQCNV